MSRPMGSLGFLRILLSGLILNSKAGSRGSLVFVGGSLVFDFVIVCAFPIDNHTRCMLKMQQRFHLTNGWTGNYLSLEPRSGGRFSCTYESQMATAILSQAQAGSF